MISWDFVKYTLTVSHRHKRVYAGGSSKPVASHTDANGFPLCLDETTRDGTKGSGQINSQESVMPFGHWYENSYCGIETMITQNHKQDSKPNRGLMFALMDILHCRGCYYCYCLQMKGKKRPSCYLFWRTEMALFVLHSSCSGEVAHAVPREKEEERSHFDHFDHKKARDKILLCVGKKCSRSKWTRNAGLRPIKQWQWMEG